MTALNIFNFHSIPVVKNVFYVNTEKKNLSNALVTFQFAVVLLLIVSGLFIRRQNAYLLNQELGFNKDNVLILTSGFEFRNNELSGFKNDLTMLPEVGCTCLTSQKIGTGLTMNGYRLGNDNNTLMFNVLYTDPDFLNCFDLRLISGRNFYPDGTIEQNAIIVNQQLVNKAGWEDPVNQKIYRGEALNIIGVVSNFNFASLYSEIKPLIVSTNPAFDGWGYNYVNIRYQTTDIKLLMGKIGGLWQKRFPDIPYEISFLDDILAQNYTLLTAQQKVVAFFGSLAVVIACAGLFGLTFFVTGRRTKEIGIRKVNGAMVAEVMAMLNKDFVKWVGIAFVIATPVAWYAMNKWLQNFAYKTSLSWWVFALAGVLALGIALLTVNWQSYRAATRNPVEALRYE